MAAASRAPTSAPSTQNRQALSRRMRSSWEGGENKFMEIPEAVRSADCATYELSSTDKKRHSRFDQCPSSSQIPQWRDEFTNIVFCHDYREETPAMAIMDAQHFGPAAIICGDGFSRSMNAEIRKGMALQIFNLRVRRDSHPQIIIHGKVERGVKRTDQAP